jgi:hypothetical protein
MPFMVQIGPPQISIHQGQTVLISDPDGQINWPSERGLYFLDTRVVSSWTVYANGEHWELLNGRPITYYAARIFLTNRSFVTESGIIPPRTLGFTIGRWIYGGMDEDLDITNNSMKPVRFQLEIAIRCDFADLFELKSGNIVRRGRITTEWREDANNFTQPILMATSTGQLSLLRTAPQKKRFMQMAGSASKYRSNLGKRGIHAFSML